MFFKQCAYLGMNLSKHPNFRCHLGSQGKWHTRVPRGRPWYNHYRGDLAKQRGTDTPKYSHQIKIDVMVDLDVAFSVLTFPFLVGQVGMVGSYPRHCFGQATHQLLLSVRRLLLVETAHQDSP